MRRLAARSGVSQAEISKVERGLVRQPEAGTLVAIAHALALQPDPLLAAARHIDLRSTRTLLADLLADGGDVAEEWVVLGWDASEARALALDDETPAVEIRKLAARVFPTARAHDTRWAIHALDLGEADPELDALLAAWPRLSIDRRRLLAEVAETLRNPGIECTGAGRDPR